MNKKKIYSMLVLSALLGCGGGGGGDDSDFAGVWTGTVSLVEDGCGVVDPAAAYVFFTHLVSQDQEDIVLDNGLVTFSGSVRGENGFEVSTERAASPLAAGQTCTETIVWRYAEVDGDSAPFVVRRSTLTCTGGDTPQTCQYAFSGSAYRSNNHGGGFPPVVFQTEGDGGPGDASASSDPATSGVTSSEPVPETSL